MVAPLASLLYWDAMPTSRTMLNKDGAFMACLHLRGPDLHSAMDSALVVQADRLNNVLLRIGAGWGLLSEARRWEVRDYPATWWCNPVAAAIDAERRQTFFEPQTHFATESTLTVTYKPTGTTSVVPHWKHWLYANLPAVDIDTMVLRFEDEVQRLVRLLGEACEEVTWLDGEAFLTYLHSTVSWHRQAVRLPDPACYLDTYLTDTDLRQRWVLPHLGAWPMLGEQYLRCVSVKAYPTKTSPGMLDILDTLPLEYRACVRYLPLARAKAVSEARKYGDSYYGKRTRAGGSTARVEKSVLDASDEAAEFQRGIEAGLYSAGYCTQTVVVWDADFQRATEKAQDVEQALNAAKYLAKIEGLNTMAAWDGTLPGNVYANVRQPPNTSENLAHLLPVTSTYRGPQWNAHLQGPSLLLATGRGHVPCAVDTYARDVGHFFCAGPTGMGKSTLANLMVCQWLRYAGAQVYIFEMGESFRCVTYAVGGHWWDVGAEVGRVFNAHGHLDDADFHPWASAWIPPAGGWHCFELTGLMRTPRMVPGVVQAITRVIEAQLTGAPTMILYDEAWKYVRPLAGLDIDASAFQERIEEQLRTARKLNAMVGFLTQSLADMAKSPLAAVLAESCPTRVFLANARALEPDIGTLYEGYGVTPRQRQIIAALAPMREYLVQGPGGDQVIDLQLGPIQLAFCGSGRKEDLAAMAELYTSDPAAFPWRWLQHKGLHQDAEALQRAYQEEGV